MASNLNLLRPGIYFSEFKYLLRLMRNTLESPTNDDDKEAHVDLMLRLEMYDKRLEDKNRKGNN